MSEKKTTIVLRMQSEGYKAFKVMDDNFNMKNGDILVHVTEYPWSGFNDQNVSVVFDVDDDSLQVNGWKLPKSVNVNMHHPGQYGFTRVNMNVISPDGLEICLEQSMDCSLLGPVEIVNYIYDALWFTALDSADSYEEIGRAPSTTGVQRRSDAELARMVRSLAHLKKLKRTIKSSDSDRLTMDVSIPLEKEYNHRLNTMLKLALY